MAEDEPGALSREGAQLAAAMEAMGNQLGAQISALTALCAVLAREVAARTVATDHTSIDRVEAAIDDTVRCLPAHGREHAAAVIDTVLAMLRAHETPTAH